jgi:hypothetical protein
MTSTALKNPRRYFEAVPEAHLRGIGSAGGYELGAVHQDR